VSKLNPKQLDLTKDIVMSGGNIFLNSGSASSPPLRFSADTDTGIYLISAAKIGISTSGVQRLFINTASVTSNVQIRGISGSASSPSYAFSNSFNTGVFLDSSSNTLAPSLSLSVNGSATLTLQSDQTIIAQGNTAFKIPTGITSERPSTPYTGMIRYNTNIDTIEVYDGSTWGKVQLSTGPVINNLKVITSDYTIQYSDYYIIVNASSNNITLTLPLNIDIGTSYIIKRIDNSSNIVEILPSESMLIDGQSSMNVKNQYSCYSITTDSNNWFIV